MLTVKIITANGNEWLIEATEVTRTLPDYQTTAPTAAETVWLHRTNGEIHPITEGSVFVMNESGKTVARYSPNAAPQEAVEPKMAA